MIRKLFFSTLICLGLHTVALAQQDPLYSQYMFNMMGINPAYAGSRELLSVSAMARHQWVGVKGAPVSNVLTGDFALPQKKVGLGFQVSTDKIGVTNTTDFSASYAYRLKMKKGTLAMGLQGGFSAFKANYTAVEMSSDVPDAAFASNVNIFKPTIGAGAYWSTDKFYAGISVPHLLHYSTTASSDNGYYQHNHWILTAGYVFNLSTDVVLKPSALLRVVKGAPVTADFNTNVWFYSVVSLGASVRTSGIIVGMFELQVSKQFRFGYAYDRTPTAMSSKGSHEFLLRYEFGFEKKRMYSPRYF